MTNYVFPYGKHKGQEIGAVPLDYLEWLIKKNEEDSAQFRLEIARRKREQQQAQPTLPLTTIAPGHIRVVAGGETGVDQGALLAAQAIDVETGGYACLGWMTEEGAEPELLRGFGLVEGGGYNEEFGHNVGIADAVIVCGQLTGGTKLVASLTALAEKPLYHNYWQGTWSQNPRTVYKWLLEQQARIICVAGNRESKNPGIGVATQEFMLETLAYYGESKKVPF